MSACESSAILNPDMKFDALWTMVKSVRDKITAQITTAQVTNK